MCGRLERSGARKAEEAGSCAFRAIRGPLLIGPASSRSVNLGQRGTHPSALPQSPPWWLPGRRGYSRLTKSTLLIYSYDGFSMLLALVSTLYLLSYLIGMWKVLLASLFTLPPTTHFVD